ncbi:uncharacterized protein LOC124692285 isoform X2 [Lolium rigidum]|uniref:uncharacterized protein LOC124692285 isoform X2 n=1 Tax=Lolium rigidum TaxID=89674 RepID=UPI001F5C0C77|nr:uncharacterized protein LOC124692285 isoform X2 [Lolium rigidum]
MRQLPCDKRGGGLAAADSGRARFGLVDDDDDDDQINEQQCLDEIQIRTIKRPDAAAATPAPFAHSAMRSQISGEIMVAARPTHQPHQAEASVVSVVKMEPKWPSSHPPSSRDEALFFVNLEDLAVIQELWREIGWDELEQDNVLLQLDADCLNVYRKKAEQTRKEKELWK